MISSSGTLIITGGICSHKRVEFHWWKDSATHGDVVCHDCRIMLRFTTIPNFVDYLVKKRKTYMKATPR